MSIRFVLTSLWKNAWLALRNYNKRLLTRVIPTSVKSAGESTKYVVGSSHHPEGRLNKFATWFHETVYAYSKRPVALQVASLRTPVYGFLGGLTLNTYTSTSKADNDYSLCREVREIFEHYDCRLDDDDDGDDRFDNKLTSLTDIHFGDVIAKGCNAVVYEGWLKNLGINNKPIDSKDLLAIKVMFNYGIESNADSILRAMRSEIVPATIGNRGFRTERRQKVHYNIVDIKSVLVDKMPLLPDAWSLYPDALPLVYNSNGLGRSMTMFIVMDRHDMNLREYLSCNPTTSSSSHSNTVTTRLVLSAQLLEGVAYLSAQHLAHRDLKSDNILISYGDPQRHVYPRLVISDFGCCVRSSVNTGGGGILVPYYTEDMCKGGNYLLMAPEIVSCEAGDTVYLDYSKSDLWSAATIIYEMFTASNPFYTHLANCSYTDADLPDLADSNAAALEGDGELDLTTLQYLSCVVKLMMSREVTQRMSVEVAANLVHCLLLRHITPPGVGDEEEEDKEEEEEKEEEQVSCDDLLLLLLCDVWTRFTVTPCRTLAHLHRSFITRLAYPDILTALLLLDNITAAISGTHNKQHYDV